MKTEFFVTGHKPNSNIVDIIDDDEQIIWQGAPKKRAYLWNAFFTMLPVALIWALIDTSFILIMASIDVFEAVPQMKFFMIPFFILHLLPVWIWLFNVLSANKRYKNISYALTNKRILIRTGFIGIDFKSLYYSEITSVNLKVGAIDKMLGVGDIHIQGKKVKGVLVDLVDVYEAYKLIQKTVADIQTDISYPNEYRPKANPGYKSKYDNF